MTGSHGILIPVPKIPKLLHAGGILRRQGGKATTQTSSGLESTRPMNSSDLSDDGEGVSALPTHDHECCYIDTPSSEAMYCAGEEPEGSGISLIMLEHTTPGKWRQRKRKRRNKGPTKGAGRDKDEQNALKEYKLQVRYQAMMKCSSKNCGGNDWMDVSKALRVILAICSSFLCYVGVCSIFSRTVPESKLFNIFALRHVVRGTFCWSLIHGHPGRLLSLSLLCTAVVSSIQC